MVDVGELNIKGSFNISEIQRGQTKVQTGFQNIQGQASSTFGSFNRLNTITKGLSQGFQNIAMAGTGIFTALAAKAPQLAPAFASIEKDVIRLGLKFGEVLAPAFDTAANAFSGFTDFITSNTALANLTRDLGLIVGAGGLLSKLTTKLTGLKSLGKITLAVSLAFGIQKLEDEASNLIEPYVQKGLRGIGYSEQEAQRVGSSFSSELADIATDVGAGALIGSAVPGVGTLGGAVAGGAWYLGKNIYAIVKEDIFGDTDTVGGS